MLAGIWFLDIRILRGSIKAFVLIVFFLSFRFVNIVLVNEVVHVFSHCFDLFYVFIHFIEILSSEFTILLSFFFVLFFFVKIS